MLLCKVHNSVKLDSNELLAQRQIYCFLFFAIGTVLSDRKLISSLGRSTTYLSLCSLTHILFFFLSLTHTISPTYISHFATFSFFYFYKETPFPSISHTHTLSRTFSLSLSLTIGSCGQCDQIGRFISLWATFQSLW